MSKLPRCSLQHGPHHKLYSESLHLSKLLTTYYELLLNNGEQDSLDLLSSSSVIHFSLWLLSYCHSTDTQLPEIVKHPVNQSAVVGSNVTLNCTTSARPKPSITWMKNNDSYAVQSNPRANTVIPVSDNRETIHHQLVITGVNKEDYGKYQCVAQNSAGEKTSEVAFLNEGANGGT